MPENPIHPVKKSDDGFRDVKCTLSREEFGLVNWAQNQAQRPPGLAPFMRRALFEALRVVIVNVASRGGKIPPGVAKEYEQWKIEMETGQ